MNLPANTPRFILTIFVIGVSKIEGGGFKSIDDMDLNDISSLSELPIEKLLLLRQSLKHDGPSEHREYISKKLSKTKQPSNYGLDDKENMNGDKSKETMDRTTTDWGHEEHDFHGLHHHHHHHEKENLLWLKTKGSIQTIFQTTVTILAFLAFGGYIICLIIATSNGSNQGTVVVQQTTTTSTDNKRVKRGANKFINHKKIIIPLNNSVYDHNNHIYALCQIAEGYKKYHMAIINNKD